MSLNVIRRILESPGCAKGAAWALLVAMANRANDDGTGIYESMGNLAKTGGISRSTAFKHLPELTKPGIVVDTGEMHDWGHGLKTVIYRIDTSKLTPSVDETESEVETSPQVRPSPQNDSTQQPVVQVRNSAKSGCNLLIPRLRLRSIRLTPRAASLLSQWFVT